MNLLGLMMEATPLLASRRLNQSQIHLKACLSRHSGGRRSIMKSDCLHSNLPAEPHQNQTPNFDLVLVAHHLKGRPSATARVEQVQVNFN